VAGRFLLVQCFGEQPPDLPDAERDKTGSAGSGASGLAGGVAWVPVLSLSCAAVTAQTASAAMTSTMWRRTAGSGEPGPGVPALALEPWPAERTSRPRLPFSSFFTASAHVTAVPAASVSTKDDATRST
jgi:hypothetical protein